MSTPDKRNRPPAGATDKAGGARRHQAVRAAHSLETAEDYVEAIAEFIQTGGRARVADLARHFGVSHVTVSRTVGRLQRDGLVQTAPYAPIALTPAGRRLAQAAKRRHEVVVEFLRALGLDEQTAQMDAEGIEHHVSPATLRAFERYAGTRGFPIRSPRRPD